MLRAERSRVRISVRARGFSVFQNRLVLVPTQPPIQWLPRFFPGGKAAGA
jgi:hypothetical protein